LSEEDDYLCSEVLLNNLIEFDSFLRDKDETLKLNIALCLEELVRRDANERCSGQELNAQTLVA